MKRMLAAVLALALTIGPHSTAGAAKSSGTSVTHVVYFQGEPSGKQVVTRAADGTVTVDYTYRDNGRGPDIREVLRVGADGIPTSLRTTGKATYGSPIFESFTRRGAAAEWRTTGERGRTTLKSPAIYVPVYKSLEVFATVLRAVERSPGHRLAALPGGELRVESVRKATVVTGGEQRDVELFALTGLDTQPAYLWLTQDSSRQLFAHIVPGWRNVILEGWAPTAPELEKMQIDAEKVHLRNMAERFTHRFDGPVVIRNVRVFDSREAKLGDASDVYVRDGRIAAIYPAKSVAREIGTEIDGTGYTLLPGLFDMHTHEDAWNTALQIAGGVTTSRDMANDNTRLHELIGDIESGAVIGPRVVPAGFIEGKSPFASRGGFVVDSLEKAKDAVDWYAQHGYRQIKIYNSFNPAWVKETAEFAHLRGLRVSGHVPAFMRAQDVVEQGYDELQHINQIMLNFLVTPTTDTRTLARFYLVAEKGHALDLDSEAVKSFVALLRQRGTTVDPTLATFEDMFTQKPGELSRAFGVVADHAPVSLQRGWRTAQGDVTDRNVERYRASYQKMVDFVGLMYRAGVPLVAGTDEIAGFALHRELELYVKSGIPAAKALQIATFNGARVTGTLGETGTIEPRKRADMILVKGDPTTDISAIRNVSLVMRDGLVWYPAEVYEAMGIKRFADPPPVRTDRRTER